MKASWMTSLLESTGLCHLKDPLALLALAPHPSAPVFPQFQGCEVVTVALVWLWVSCSSQGTCHRTHPQQRQVERSPSFSFVLVVHCGNLALGEHT